MQFLPELFLSLSVNSEYSDGRLFLSKSGKRYGLNLLITLNLQPNEKHHFPHLSPPP